MMMAFNNKVMLFLLLTNRSRSFIFQRTNRYTNNNNALIRLYSKSDAVNNNGSKKSKKKKAKLQISNKEEFQKLFEEFMDSKNDGINLSSMSAQDWKTMKEMDAREIAALKASEDEDKESPSSPSLSNDFLGELDVDDLDLDADDDEEDDFGDEVWENELDEQQDETLQYVWAEMKSNPKFNMDELFDEISKAEGLDESTALYAEDNDGSFDESDQPASVVSKNNKSAKQDDEMKRRILEAKMSEVGFDDDDDEDDMPSLSKIGLKKETNFFGKDETPRNMFLKMDNPLECPACGVDFQCKNESKPGYLPKEKFEIQQHLAKVNNDEEWSVDDEINWLLQEQAGVDAAAEESVDDEMAAKILEIQSKNKRIICKRCHQLQNFGTVDKQLRSGWTDEPLLAQEAFLNLLKPLRSKKCVLIALVDLFDFSGSILPELDTIAGSNPVLIAANKADLLPAKMGTLRAENWVRRELEYMGIQSLANIGGSVNLVSCKTGFGVSKMLSRARRLSDEMECDVYVIGAANAGKSTLLNRLVDANNLANEDDTAAEKKRKKRAGNANAFKGTITTSPLPGTTLKFIKIDFGNGQMLYDTPGLLAPGTLTTLLTPEELKMVVPKKPVEAVTLRIAPGKCVLVGGLARVEVLPSSKPFLFTFYVSNDIKLHSTDVSKADAFVQNQTGTFLTPPLAPGPERLEQLGKFVTHDLQVEGDGWKEASADITLRGLGWVAVTGPGVADIRISVPEGIGVEVRPPLMPFDVWETTAKYTGGRTIRKGGKTKSGKYRKGVGRR